MPDLPKMSPEAQRAYDEALRRIEECRQQGEEGTDLDLSGLRLTQVPPEIGQLSALTQLRLDTNLLTSLPPEIGQLSALTLLHLYNNLLTSLPLEMGQLTKLEELLLFTNQLASLPPEIGQLTALTRLDFYNNNLTSLPPEIGQLTALRLLELSINQLTSLPPQIGQLSALMNLYLDNNQIASLPAQIGQLSALTHLFLEHNQLTSLPPQIGQLSALTHLFLFHNQLTSLPTELSRLNHLEVLFLHQNPRLGLLAEMLGPTFEELRNKNATPADPKEILAHYFAQRRGRTRPLNEVKVLVVGESEVGKTSLIRQLLGEDFNPGQSQTHGIERHRLMMNCGRLGEVRLNVWDFGGQDIMHATHQFFLSHRSVYVLVLDSRQNERQTRIDYWLRLIASYGGDSPVIVVCNKADQQVMQLNWTALQREHPQIKAFAKEVCCRHVGNVDERKGLEELKGLIAQAVEEHVAEVDRPMLNQWLDLKDELETDGRPYLTLQEYHALAAQRGIKEQKDRELLLTVMHRLGSVLHFSEHAIFEQERARQAAPAHVEELNVLDPGWVTEAIYRLLNDAKLIRAGGKMDRGSMRAALAQLPGDRYPGTKKDFIIAMMKRFEICFVFDGEQDQWFLPDLLHKDEVDTGDWQGAMTFRYQYKVLPGSVMGRFLVRLHGHIANRCLWRTGAKFRKDQTEALVRSNTEEAQVDIFIRGGTKRERQDFLALIRGTLEDIHRSFSGHLAVEEQISIPKHPEVYVDYEKLLLLEGQGTPGDMVKVNGKIEGFQVAEALNQVTDKHRRDAERRKRAPRDGHEPRGAIIHNYIQGDYIEGDKSNRMNTDSHNLTIHGNIINSQVGQTLTNCTNMVQQQAPGELKTLLEKLQQDVKRMMEQLPEEKQEEVAKDLQLLTQEATAQKPNRKWYSVSSEGLLEAANYVKDFSGSIAETIGSLTKLLGFS
ncbi:COR domain-containing protein [Brevifollis gellanilyticus]|uniref:non-specific serine/threonine protein kinase n=1 Tax=Brevifollis gellanilyticus TaxID=748831 RepID=A0A512MI09_9BACT|nr:COR domain-containing protein [Brevifollis gellanilyticus]GEP46376.1 hypothetical protein BGE01nite_56670 [Brevifollis gellanilyticus]